MYAESETAELMHKLKTGLGLKITPLFLEV